MPTVTFSITGEYITNHVRSLTTEGRHQHALKTLEAGFPELPIRECYKILSGDRKLSGNSCCHLQDDDDQEHKRRLHEMFRGVVWRDGVYWRPYAYVSSWGPQDLLFESRVQNKWLKRDGSKVSQNLLAINRCAFYMDDSVNDRAEVVFHSSLGTIVALWKAVPEPPPFIEHSTSFQKGMDVYSAAGGYLCERGHHLHQHSSQLGEHYEVAIESANELVSGDTVSELIESSGLPAEAVVGIMSSGPEKAVEVDIADAQRGWCSPDGKVYACLYGKHHHLAGLLVGDENINDPMEHLMRRGWAKFYDNNILDNKPSIVSRSHLTARQQDVMQEWCVLNKSSLDEAYYQSTIGD